MWGVLFFSFWGPLALSQSFRGGLKLPLTGSIPVVSDHMCFAPHPL